MLRRTLVLVALLLAAGAAAAGCPDHAIEYLCHDLTGGSELCTLR